MLTFNSLSDYDLRGYKISVAMAEKSAPKAPPAYDHGYRPLIFELNMSRLDVDINN